MLRYRIKHEEWNKNSLNAILRVREVITVQSAPADGEALRWARESERERRVTIGGAVNISAVKALSGVMILGCRA